MKSKKKMKPYCIEYVIIEPYTFISEPDFWDTRERVIESTRSKEKRKYFTNKKEALEFKRGCSEATLLTYKKGYI